MKKKEILKERNMSVVKANESQEGKEENNIKDLNISSDNHWQKPVKDILSLKEEDNIDRIIDIIKFMHPRTPFTHFCIEKRKQYNKDKKVIQNVFDLGQKIRDKILLFKIDNNK